MYQKIILTIFGTMPKNIILIICIFLLGTIFYCFYNFSEIANSDSDDELIENIIRVVLASIFLWFGIDAYKLKRYLESPNPDTHVKCPDCRELVKKDANKCIHCGCKLIPQ